MMSERRVFTSVIESCSRSSLSIVPWRIPSPPPREKEQDHRSEGSEGGARITDLQSGHRRGANRGEEGIAVGEPRSFDECLWTGKEHAPGEGEAQEKERKQKKTTVSRPPEDSGKGSSDEADEWSESCEGRRRQGVPDPGRRADLHQCCLDPRQRQGKGDDPEQEGNNRGSPRPGPQLQETFEELEEGEASPAQCEEPPIRWRDLDPPALDTEDPDGDQQTDHCRKNSCFLHWAGQAPP